MYYVYILKWNNKHHIWCTNNIESRLKEYKYKKIKALKSMKDVELLWYFEKESSDDARRLEMNTLIITCNLYNFMFIVHTFIYEIITMTDKINVNIRIDKELKDNATKIANEMWLTFSAVVNIYLNNFIKEKRITIDLNDDKVVPFLDTEKEEFESLSNFNWFMDSVKWK